MPSLEATHTRLSDLRAVRAESDRFFNVLVPEALFERPIAERHRVIFYIGHLDGFDSIQICREGLDIPSPDPELDVLFQAGIDPDSDALPTDTAADWPSLEQVRAYVERCRSHVDRHLEQASEDSIHFAIEHRQMHLETLAYMFHNLDYRFKRSAQLEDVHDAGTAESFFPENAWIDIPAGDALLGKADDGSFGWDNEYQEHCRAVPSFRIQQRSISNGEYLRFVEAGAPLPHFWARHGDALYYRGMLGEHPLPLDWPVYVTQNEAQAYASWLGRSLMTEEQFHRAAYGTARSGQRRYPWGDAEPARWHGNFDLRRWDPEPVDATPSGRSAFGVEQLVGNGWQWTSSVFGPFEGFKPNPKYAGYSANFFDGKHYVMKGGSPRTAARLLRRSFRNWFRADYPYVYATFRCVENA